MANSLEGRVWVLDTTGSVTTDPVKVDQIIWSDITNDDDDLEILTASGGGRLWKVKGKSGIDMHVDMDGQWFDGIYLNTLDSGEVTIYLL